MKIYRYIWIPCRILLYLVTYIHVTYYFNLVDENTKSNLWEDNIFLKVFVLIIYPISCFHFEVFIHYLIYKNPNEHVDSPAFKGLKQRFSKEEIENFKPKVKELLSHSHKTEKELKGFLMENEREEEMRY